MVLVLIETSWNVKKYERLGKDLEEYSINRNIVECKGVLRSVEQISLKCINRNIVECKVTRSGMKCEILKRINRNIVECKEENREIHSLQKMVLIETSWNVKFEASYCTFI